LCTITQVTTTRPMTTAIVIAQVDTLMSPVVCRPASFSAISRLRALSSSASFIARPCRSVAISRQRHRQKTTSHAGRRRWTQRAFERG
jgi:hypothetical protein